MLLSYRFLNDVAGVNNFEVAAAIEINAGDAQDLYIQLIDAALDRTEQGYIPSGRRYMPSVGASLVVTFTNIDTGPTVANGFETATRINPSVPAKVIRTAAQPFAQDGSIWSIPVLASDPLNGTVQIKLVLVEPSRTLTVNPQPGMFLRVR